MSTVDDLVAMGWTMQGLAEALDIEPSTLYRWRERGETQVARLALWAIHQMDDPERHDGATVRLHSMGPRDFGAYIIRCGDAVKIGRTSVDPEVRLAQLQHANPRRLELLAYFPGTRESVLHERFKQHQIQGEWFRMCPDIAALCR